MKTETKRIFNQRAFIAAMAGLTGMALPITGYANHLLQMDPMTLLRHAWMTAHNVLGVLFIVSVVWHVLLNRRVFLNHIRAHAGLWHMSRETVCAVALVSTILFIVVGHAFHLR